MEKLVIFLEYLPRPFEQLNAMCQAVGDIHVSTVDPELAVHSLVDLVVQDDEVADMLKFDLRLSIEFVYLYLSDAIVREVLNESSQTGLYQMDTG